MSEVPGSVNTYVIVLETPRAGIDLQRQAWLTEYFYARIRSKAPSSWDSILLRTKIKDKIWHAKWKSFAC